MPVGVKGSDGAGKLCLTSRNSPAVAARLGKLFGDGAPSGCAWQAEHDLAEELASISTLTAA